MVTISVMCVFIPSDVTFKQTKLRLYQATMLQEKKKKESSKVVKWVCSFVVQLTKALIVPNSLFSLVHE